MGITSNPFGWDYPPGAENDPNAPWNQEDDPETCPICDGENDPDEDFFPYCSKACEIVAMRDEE